MIITVTDNWMIMYAVFSRLSGKMASRLYQLFFASNGCNSLQLPKGPNIRVVLPMEYEIASWQSNSIVDGRLREPVGGDCHSSVQLVRKIRESRRHIWIIFK